MGKMTFGMGKASPSPQVPAMEPVERIVEIIKEVRVEVPVEVIRYIDRPVEVIKVVEKRVEVPVETIQKVFVDVPVYYTQEKIVEVPVIKEVEIEKIVRIPVVEIRKHVPQYFKWIVALAVIETIVLIAMAS
jgi:hypothetical protein